MATATKKAGNAAKTTNKTNNKKLVKETAAPAKKQSKVKASSKNNNAEVLIKPENTVEGTLDHPMRQKTAKSIKPKVPATAKSASSNGKQTAARTAQTYGGFDTQPLVQMYRTMYTSRRVDDKEIQLKGQN